MRRHYRAALAGYIQAPELDAGRIAGFLVPPELGDNAGVCGALALAEDASAARRA
jgi:fructokinase